MIQNQKIPQMKTISEASKITKITKYRLRQMVRQNKVIYLMAGNKVLINLESLLSYMTNGDNNKKESEEKNDTTRKIN